tara:strand:- start:145 stop:591 length:447 start_codon:yes stop_codon:yes gene_type:complete
MKTLELIPSKLLPHKAPMLLIDEVLNTDFEKNITVQTTVKENNFFFQGHFPDYPLLPGVVMIEMMFQACGILNRAALMSKSNTSSNQNRIGKAVKINSATFMKEVFPETSLIIKAQKIRSLLKFSEYKAIVVTENGDKVCEAELIVTM